MSVPTSISQLSTTASQNSPAGTEPIGNNLALYLNAAFAFIAQLANGSGLTQTQALNMASYQINNLAAGVANTDAINYGQLKSYLPIGNIQMWSGAVANIPSVWGADWALCNGQNGTPNLMDRFVVGAGNLYAPGAVGGSTSISLSTANLPAHNHPVSDGGHAHPYTESPHNHPVYENPHVHTYNCYVNGSTNAFGWAGAGVQENGLTGLGTTNASTTGLSIGNATSNLTIYSANSNISVGNTGSGQAFTVVPPYYAVCYVMKISNS
jgi:hypothetical protein